jgi:hypothetical protein
VTAAWRYFAGLAMLMVFQMSGWAADIRRTRHIGDFTRWKEHDAYTKALERLLRDLRIEKG